MDKTARDIHDVFDDFLRDKNLKLTWQRMEILDTFLKTSRHLSVDELYTVVRKKSEKIGRATVFRTLKLLSESEIAREVDFGDKIARYEKNYGIDHHDHLICVKCSKYIEAMNPEIERLQDKLCADFGFKPTKHRLEIFGICKECRG